MNKRPTRKTRSTRITTDPDEVPARPRRRTRSVRSKPAQQPEPVAAESSRPRKKRPKKEPAGYKLKPSDVARRSKAKKPPPSTRTVILAMSPHAANILRAMLAKSHHEVPELIAIQLELEDQLG